MSISLQSVTKTYPRGREAVTAVCDVDLDIGDGEFAVFMGVSGSGKSTLLNLIGGLDRPTRGRVVVNGTELGSMDARARALFRRAVAGFVFQSFQLIPTLTVLENVMLPLVPVAGSRGDKQRRARELVGQVGLGGRASHLPGELSGGEQQRVAIARAMVNNPSVLLADEPTSDLDTKTGRQIIELLQRFNAEGKTVVLATHDERLSAGASQVVRLEDGKIV